MIVMLLVGTFTVANNHIKKLAGRQEYKNSQARVRISLTNYIYPYYHQSCFSIHLVTSAFETLNIP